MQKLWKIKVCGTALLGSLLTCHPGLSEEIDTQERIRSVCSGSGSQVAMKDCILKKSRESEILLGQAEENVRKVLTKWDESLGYVAQSKTRFERDVRAFSRYRKDHCQFLESLVGGAAGNSRAIMQLACVTELNYRRVMQLRDAVATLPMK